MAFKFTGRGLAVEKPVRVEIIDPATGAPLTCKIAEQVHTAFLSVYSSDSPRAKTFHAAALERRLRLSRVRQPSGKEIEDEQTDFLANLTAGWCLITPDHDLIEEPFSEDAARALYADPQWQLYRETADRAIGNRANFTPGSPAS